MPKHVTVPAAGPAPVPATLAEQKADFTAEGSPPPGKVSTTAPVTPVAAPKPKSRSKASPERRKRAG